jgi:hypothetical protein
MTKQCVPIRRHVPGSPFQPKDVVRVVDAIDVEVHDVSRYIGQVGRVVHLEYSCGCGQQFPDDPAVGVKFANGDHEEFWPEELVRVERKATGGRK